MTTPNRLALIELRDRLWSRMTLAERDAFTAALAPESGGREDADIALTLAGADLAATIAHAECLEIAERWAAQYPVDVFLPDGTSIEARAAHHARRVAGFIAEDIRKLAVENRPPAPSSPSSAQGEGEA